MWVLTLSGWAVEFKDEMDALKARMDSGEEEEGVNESVQA